MTSRWRGRAVVRFSVSNWGDGCRGGRTAPSRVAHRRRRRVGPPAEACVGGIRLNGEDDEALDAFSPATRAWFTESFAAPTAVQAGRAGRPSRSGEHALVVAPTGSGKTLAAFLWAIDRLRHAAADAARRHTCRSTSRR